MYLLMFFLALLPFAVFCALKQIGFKWVATLFEIISSVVLSVFAGIRDLTVGTDVTFYMEPSFKFATLYPSFSMYWKSYHFEFLYALLSYYISKFTGNVNLFFFILMLITSLFVFFSINDEFYDTKPIFAFLLFFFGFYNLSLNYSRQMIAVAILLYLYKYLKNGKYLKYFIGVIIAFLFHRTALIGLLIFVLYHVFRLRKNNRIIFNTIFVGIFLFFLILYNKILSFAINHGLIDAKYIVHIASGLDIHLTSIVFHLVLIALTAVFIYYARLNDEEKSFFFEIIVLDFCLFLISLISDTANRIELYTFVYMSVTVLPHCIKKLELSKISILFWEIMIGIMYVVYWYITIILQNVGQTYPYRTIFFSIN